MRSNLINVASRSLIAASLARHSAASVPPSASSGIVSISAAFDAGNVVLVSQIDQMVTLRIRPDPYTALEEKSHMQWFAFRSTLLNAGVPTEVTFKIENAGACSYAGAWPGYDVVASHDKKSWHRVKGTRYDSERGTLSWDWAYDASPAAQTVYFSYFDLYPYERHLDLVARSAAVANAPSLSVGTLGQTLDGRELDIIRVGTGSLRAWIVHRQHPGESMAAFYGEGLLTRLLGLHSGGVVDGLTSKLLRRFTFYVVPCMNPDGAVRGHLRVNAAGANLNREWAPTGEYEAPTLERSPEVYHVLNAMDESGVDVFVDVHGDEALPFTFLAGSEGLPVWGRRLEALHGAFVGAYTRANPDMQPTFGYEASPHAKGNLAMGANQVGH